MAPNCLRRLPGRPPTANRPVRTHAPTPTDPVSKPYIYKLLINRPWRPLSILIMILETISKHTSKKRASRHCAAWCRWKRSHTEEVDGTLETRKTPLVHPTMLLPFSIAFVLRTQRRSAIYIYIYMAV